MPRLTFSFLLCMIISAASAQQGKKIEFKAPLVYPEGVAYNSKTNIYYVSSVTTGTIGLVDASGNYKVFHKDSTLKSSFGMKIDPKQNRLWVCTADPNYSKYSDSTTFKKISKLIALDLSNGAKVAEVDLASLQKGNHFANDLTIDDKGNLYVTDSYSPVIYKIDSKQKATVWSASDLFRGKDVGLNGIVYNAKGFILVVNNSAGTILKVDVKNPATINKVKIDQFFPGADGLLLDKDGTLILIQNKGVNKVFKLQSSDNWVSAKIVESTTAEARFQNPTTATFADGNVMILNSKMNELQDSTKNPSPAYSIQQALFKPQL